MGTDLSSTRIHHDRGTAAFAAALGARAFTVGNHIGFAAGAYQPSSSEGEKLLAHEAAHVAQQRGQHPVLARKEDVTAMSLSAEYARALSDVELEEDVQAIRTYVAGLEPTDSVYDQARANRDILQDEQVTRAVRGGNIESIGTEPSIGSAVSMAGYTELQARFGRFKAGVLLAAQNRLANNIEALQQWGVYIDEHFTALGLQKQVLAQSAIDLANTAAQHGTMRAVYDWAGENNPAMREVREHQARGEWLACTGCHAEVQADAYGKETSPFEKAFNPAWQSPAERLGLMSGLIPQGMELDESFFRGTDKNFQLVLQAVERIRPVVAPLGNAGYRIIPDDVWSVRSGDTPEQLRRTIYANIAQREADYAELSAAIADGDVDYLQLGPLLQSLLAIAPADIQQAVQNDIDTRKIEAYVTMAGTLALTLLSILIPPLGLAVAAIGFASGYSQFTTGHQYALGTGANDVFTREQQDQAGELMASGVLNMGISAAAFVAQAPRAMDWTATKVIVASDLAAARDIANRAMQGPIAEAELLQLQQRGLVTRIALKWTDMRGFRIVYRGQTVPTDEILSPIAREQGIGASQSLYDQLKAIGLTDAEIAGYTARWNGEPVHPYAAPPGFGGQPLGGVGIPTTRLPNIAADFAGEGGVIYVMRVPKNLAIDVSGVGWPGMSAAESEFVVFHQIPNGYVVRTLPPEGIQPLKFDYPWLVISK